MVDYIDRQSAIEIASGFCHPANIAKELAKLPSVQPQIRGNAVNLCETCKYDFPECPKDSNVIFGDGKGNDNVCACSSYEVYVPPISKREWYQKGYEAGVKSVQPQRMRGKGRWNVYYHGEKNGKSMFSYSCNQCGYGAPYNFIGGVCEQKKWNFCPNCGADMREKK